MIEISYTSKYIRQFKKLPKALQEEAKEKISLLSKDPEHSYLKAHKLKGKLKGFWSISVNYKFRIIFEYDSKTEIALLSIGDHDIYQ